MGRLTAEGYNLAIGEKLRAAFLTVRNDACMPQFPGLQQFSFENFVDAIDDHGYLLREMVAVVLMECIESKVRREGRPFVYYTGDGDVDGEEEEEEVDCVWSSEHEEYWHDSDSDYIPPHQNTDMSEDDHYDSQHIFGRFGDYDFEEYPMAADEWTGGAMIDNQPSLAVTTALQTGNGNSSQISNVSTTTVTSPVLSNRPTQNISVSASVSGTNTPPTSSGTTASSTTIPSLPPISTSTVQSVLPATNTTTSSAINTDPSFSTIPAPSSVASSATLASQRRRRLLQQIPEYPWHTNAHSFPFIRNSRRLQAAARSTLRQYLERTSHASSPYTTRPLPLRRADRRDSRAAPIGRSSTLFMLRYFRRDQPAQCADLTAGQTTKTTTAPTPPPEGVQPSLQHEPNHMTQPPLQNRKKFKHMGVPIPSSMYYDATFNKLFWTKEFKSSLSHLPISWDYVFSDQMLLIKSKSADLTFQGCQIMEQRLLMVQRRVGKENSALTAKKHVENVDRVEKMAQSRVVGLSSELKLSSSSAPTFITSLPPSSELTFSTSPPPSSESSNQKSIKHQDRTSSPNRSESPASQRSFTETQDRTRSPKPSSALVSTPTFLASQDRASSPALPTSQPLTQEPSGNQDRTHSPNPPDSEMRTIFSASPLRQMHTPSPPLSTTSSETRLTARPKKRNKSNDAPTQQTPLSPMKASIVSTRAAVAPTKAQLLQRDQIKSNHSTPPPNVSSAPSVQSKVPIHIVDDPPTRPLEIVVPKFTPRASSLLMGETGFGSHTNAKTAPMVSFPFEPQFETERLLLDLIRQVTPDNSSSSGSVRSVDRPMTKKQTSIKQESTEKYFDTAEESSMREDESFLGKFDEVFFESQSPVPEPTIQKDNAKARESLQTSMMNMIKNFGSSFTMVDTKPVSHKRYPSDDPNLRSTTKNGLTLDKVDDMPFRSAPLLGAHQTPKHVFGRDNDFEPHVLSGPQRSFPFRGASLDDPEFSEAREEVSPQSFHTTLSGRTSHDLAVDAI